MQYPSQAPERLFAQPAPPVQGLPRRLTSVTTTFTPAQNMSINNEQYAHIKQEDSVTQNRAHVPGYFQHRNYRCHRDRRSENWLRFARQIVDDARHFDGNSRPVGHWR